MSRHPEVTFTKAGTYRNIVFRDVKVRVADPDVVFVGCAFIGTPEPGSLRQRAADWARKLLSR